MSRTIRGLGALGILVALVGGVPLALARFVGRPWPRPLPSVETIWSSMRAGDISDTTVVKALAVLIWISWARLTLSVLIEVFARTTRVETPRITGLGSTQQWAAGLIAAIVLLIGAVPRAALASGQVNSRAPISAALLHTDPVRQPVAGAERAERAPEHAPAAVRAVRHDVVPAATVHVVERHESFWSIAEDELGDGARWREIVDLNSGHEVAPGVVFDGTTSRLLPGWVLVVPDAVPAGRGSAAVLDPAVRVVRVEQGDTLSEIAEDELGDALAWPQ
ncbi:MAG: hypothetical protein ABIW84_07090, partial [Ilumatobacteraceae bacterium]